MVIDHVSVQNSFDGNIDITRVGTRDITVQWSILAEPAGEEKNMLLAFGQTRITLHHNLFIDAKQRSPQVTFDDSAARTHDTQTTLDMRNNLIWDWRGGYGTRIRYGGNANVVDNFYASDGGDGTDALIICKGLASDSQCYDDTTNIARAYVAGNVSADGVNLNNEGTESTPFAAAAVTTQAPGAAACLVRDGAGARPLDPIDQGYVSTVSLSGCVAGPAAHRDPVGNRHRHRHQQSGRHQLRRRLLGVVRRGHRRDPDRGRGRRRQLRRLVRGPGLRGRTVTMNANTACSATFTARRRARRSRSARWPTRRCSSRPSPSAPRQPRISR